MKRKPTKRYLGCIGDAVSTKELDRVRRYAQKRCRMLSRAGVRVDGLADQLVSDALADTTTRKSHWPDERPLAIHLCGLIRGRTRAMALHARRFPTVDVPDVTAPTDIEANTIRKDAVQKLITALRALATTRSDVLVVELLSAYANETTERRDVANALGISETHYDAVRNRLDRLIGKLPDDLQADARDAMNMKGNQ